MHIATVLPKKRFLTVAKTGYELGFRTFVLQGGEDGWFTVPRLADIVSDIHKSWPDCAITLSVGEMEYDAYQTLFDAGADRYLLRHETYDDAHYRMLHPASLSALHRQNCLWDLKVDRLSDWNRIHGRCTFARQLRILQMICFLLKELNPHMVGIGPFIPHHDTQFADEPAGTLELTLYLLGLIRLMLPKCPPSGNNCSRYDFSDWKGTGNSRRS